MCKQYRVDILISGSMRTLAGEAFLTRRVDRVVAYGRGGTTDIYELVATQGTALPEQVCNSPAQYTFVLLSTSMQLQFSLIRIKQSEFSYLFRLTSIQCATCSYDIATTSMLSLSATWKGILRMPIGSPLPLRQTFLVMLLRSTALSGASTSSFTPLRRTGTG